MDGLKRLHRIYLNLEMRYQKHREKVHDAFLNIKNSNECKLDKLKYIAYYVIKNSKTYPHNLFKVIFTWDKYENTWIIQKYSLTDRKNSKDKNIARNAYLDEILINEEQLRLGQEWFDLSSKKLYLIKYNILKLLNKEIDKLMKQKFKTNQYTDDLKNIKRIKINDKNYFVKYNLLTYDWEILMEEPEIIIL